MSAMPIGMPGCPALARCTASMDRARMALASSRRVVMRLFRAARGAHRRGAHFPPLAADAQSLTWDSRLAALAARLLKGRPRGGRAPEGQGGRTRTGGAVRVQSRGDLTTRLALPGARAFFTLIRGGVQNYPRQRTFSARVAGEGHRLRGPGSLWGRRRSATLSS